MDVIVRKILAERFPEWDAKAECSRLFLVYCDACIDGFGAPLEQKQLGGGVRPIAYILSLIHI